MYVLSSASYPEDRSILDIVLQHYILKNVSNLAFSKGNFVFDFT